MQTVVPGVSSTTEPVRVQGPATFVPRQLMFLFYWDEFILSANICSLRTHSVLDSGLGSEETLMKKSPFLTGLMDIERNEVFLRTQIWEQLVLPGRVRTASQRSCQRAGLGQQSSTWTPEHRMPQGLSKKHQCLTPPQTNWIHAVDTHAWASAHVEALQEIRLDSHGWEYWNWVLRHEGTKLNYKRQHMPGKTFLTIQFNYNGRR